jgi:hypothetical protein
LPSWIAASLLEIMSYQSPIIDIRRNKIINSEMDNI